MMTEQIPSLRVPLNNFDCPLPIAVNDILFIKKKHFYNLKVESR